MIEFHMGGEYFVLNRFSKAYFYFGHIHTQKEVDVYVDLCKAIRSGYHEWKNISYTNSDMLFLSSTTSMLASPFNTVLYNYCILVSFLWIRGILSLVLEFRYTAIHTYENIPKMFHNFYLADYSKVSSFWDTW